MPRLTKAQQTEKDAADAALLAQQQQEQQKQQSDTQGADNASSSPSNAPTDPADTPPSNDGAGDQPAGDNPASADTPTEHDSAGDEPVAASEPVVVEYKITVKNVGQFRKHEPYTRTDLPVGESTTIVCANAQALQVVRNNIRQMQTHRRGTLVITD